MTISAQGPFVSPADFLLDPEVVFLNNGSYGAMPRVVMEAYQRWQIELERQPVAFLARRAPELLKEAREDAARLFGTKPDNLVLMSNTTQALNTVARGLDLNPGDEVLATDLEYGAMDRMWRFLAGKKGFSYVRHAVAFPLTTHEDFVEAFWQGVTPRTRVIFMSHITSQTAIVLPVAAICRRARENGILTVIDGAHVPGLLDLNLDALDPDYYAGNLHKWFFTPKGSAILYVRPERQPLDPLIVSWGWESDEPSASRFVDYHEMQGTRDISGFLCLRDAQKYREQYDWAAVSAECRALAKAARQELQAVTGQAPFHGEDPRWFTQMATVFLPDGTDVNALKSRLYERYRIEIPVWSRDGRPLLRIAIQAYNGAAHVESLLGALKIELRGV